jgi:hypothetical protein
MSNRAKDIKRMLQIQNQQMVKQKIQKINQVNSEIFDKNLHIIKSQILHNMHNMYNAINDKNGKNTVLLIEPRNIQEIEIILANCYNKLGDSWNYVFYCGKSFFPLWREKFPSFIEVRPLENDNFEDTRLYSDFCKKKELWDSLYGEFVLTIQLDTWIMSIAPYDIDYFIRLNKSYIGGNMEYTWGYFDKIDLKHDIRNFNGGLSLRKREDMLKVIETYPPSKTLDDRSNFLAEHEDVYFTYGCIQLNLPIGDDNESSHFSLHTICKDKYFGVHQAHKFVSNQLKKTNPYLQYLNQFLFSKEV